MIDRWWKQLNVETNLSFIRDRIVECHFWMTGACCEPQYSLSRVIATKMTALITVLDDMMDTYSTTEEAMLLAEAIYRYDDSEPPLAFGCMMQCSHYYDSLLWYQWIIVKCRWEENAAELLPRYMKDFYLYLLKTIDSCGDELGPNRSFRTFYLKEMASLVLNFF
jgi:hypothetical protein